MRSITFHPASLALGVILGVISFVSMGQATTITPSVFGSTVRVEYLPHPSDMVQIRGGTPYTVPPGKIFVLTGLGNYAGSSGTAQTVGLLVNGQREVTVAAAVNVSPSVKAVPVGFTVSAGSTVDVVEITGSQEPLNPRAWGYLAPQ